MNLLNSQEERTGCHMGRTNEIEKNDKLERILGMYTKLMNGGSIYKAQEAAKYGVSTRSIQRDIDEIRNFLATSSDETGIVNTVSYDRSEDRYRLEKISPMRLTNSEILAVLSLIHI